MQEAFVMCEDVSSLDCMSIQAFATQIHEELASPIVCFVPDVIFQQCNVTTNYIPVEGSTCPFCTQSFSKPELIAHLSTLACNKYAEDLVQVFLWTGKKTQIQILR